MGLSGWPPHKRYAAQRIQAMYQSPHVAFDTVMLIPKIIAVE